MLVGIVLILCKRRRREGRAPETLAGVLVLLCGSQMLGDFQGMAKLESKERNRIVTGWRKSYGLGSLLGVDGVEREGVGESLFVGNRNVP